MNKKMWMKLALERGDTIDELREMIKRLKVQLKEAEVWKDPWELIQYHNSLITQLQDANRKLAALGHFPAKGVVAEVVVTGDVDEPFKAYKLAQEREIKEIEEMYGRPIRSLSQQEWDDYEVERDRDFRETISDAYNSGNP